MKHIVEISELADFSFSQVVCSSYPKRLNVHVKPVKNSIYYELQFAGDFVQSFNSLENALVEYNKL